MRRWTYSVFELRCPCRGVARPAWPLRFTSHGFTALNPAHHPFSSEGVNELTRQAAHGAADRQLSDALQQESDVTIGCLLKNNPSTIRRRLRETKEGWYKRSCAAFIATTLMSVPLTAPSSALAQQEQQRPNILFIMGDDIGWMQPSIYHRGLMVGETPNIDRIGDEGAIFMDYYAE